MESLETGKDKIRKICEILKQETLEPAKEEAQQIVSIAQKEALQIVRDAEAKAEMLLQKTQVKLEKERELFENSLKMASRQSLEALRQDIEKHLFNDQLSSWVDKQTQDPQMAAHLIEALIKAIEKEGLSTDFSAYIPAKLPVEKVNALLARSLLDKLREKKVLVASFLGGVQIKLHDKKLLLDLSDEALKELMARYVRKDFRDLLFQAS